MENKEKTKSKFLKISCPRCKKIQIVFGKSALTRKCEHCNKLLIKTSGGKAKVMAFVNKVLWR